MLAQDMAVAAVSPTPETSRPSDDGWHFPFFGKFFGILRFTLGRQKGFERVTSENPAVFKLLDELCEGYGHGGSIRGCGPV